MERKSESESGSGDSSEGNGRCKGGVEMRRGYIGEVKLKIPR